MSVKIRLQEKELLHLINISGYGRAVTVHFDPSGSFVNESTPMWILQELCKLRGINTSNTEERKHEDSFSQDMA